MALWKEQMTAADTITEGIVIAESKLTRVEIVLEMTLRRQPFLNTMQWSNRNLMPPSLYKILLNLYKI